MKLGLLAILAGFSGAAYADPCEGPLPSKRGTVFSSLVRYVVDGDGFCISDSANPNTWVEVRMSDFDSPELATAQGKTGKSIIERLISGKQITCVTRLAEIENPPRTMTACLRSARWTAKASPAVSAKREPHRAATDAPRF